MADSKRVKYFDQQLLVLGDFTDEQEYHIEMRRRHNQALHTFGAAPDGLEVKKAANSNKVLTISPGTAFDNKGKEIVVPEGDPRNLDLSDNTKYPPNSTLIVYIAYKEGDGNKENRWSETPEVDAKREADVASDGSVIRLARISLGASGNIDRIDSSVRQIAGAKGLTGLKSLLGVAGDPSGNIALVGNSPIQIAAVPGTNQIAFSSVGTLLAKDYDLRQRQIVSVNFNNGEQSGAVKTVSNLGFQTKFVLAMGTFKVTLNNRDYGVQTCGFDTITNGSQACGAKITRFNSTSGVDWASIGILTGGISVAGFENNAPAQSETVTVTVDSVTATELKLKMTKTPLTGTAAPWSITLQILCMG